ncbi:ABC transporter permease [Marinicrinis lubricantis]|uniref:ABC transporter permease n=1 Tax=Marinicrinis lubricantis TaxID=2086470 RepID=A0ABW1ITN6_9BACL
MKQWFVLYQKEMLEYWRTSKWLWVPIVFILLGVMNPITSYYMPEILKNAGGLPEGAIIEIPIPAGNEVMVQALSQYGTVGVLILVLAFMGIVSAECNSGAASMIFVKPVRYSSYITAKWAAMMTLCTISFALGYLFTWYYTEMLISPVDELRILWSFMTYWIWLAFVLSLTLFFSSWLKSSGAIAFISLLCILGLSAASSLLPRFTKWSPSRLSDQAGHYLLSGETLPEGFAVFLVAGLLIVGFVTFSVYVLKKREMSH